MSTANIPEVIEVLKDEAIRLQDKLDSINHIISLYNKDMDILDISEEVINALEDRVCEATRTETKELYTDSRKAPIILAKYIMYLFLSKHNWHVEDIALKYNVDRTSVIHGINRIKYKYRKIKETKQLIDNLINLSPPRTTS